MGVGVCICVDVWLKMFANGFNIAKYLMHNFIVVVVVVVVVVVNYVSCSLYLVSGKLYLVSVRMVYVCSFIL